jgi:hypothetical protein
MPAWSGNSVVYRIGQEVGYNGELYECIQGHTSEPNWMPPAVPALWKDMGPCGSTPTSVVSHGTPVIYPNPVTSSNVTLQLPVSNTTSVKVQIFTIAFREVQNQTVVVNGDSLSLSMVDRSGVSLANGLYYLVIQADGQKWVNKLLILR